MMTLNCPPLRPFLRHRQQQLSHCSTSLPFTASAGLESTQSSQKLVLLSSCHHSAAAAARIPPSNWCPESRRWLSVVACRGRVCSIDRNVLRKVSSVATSSSFQSRVQVVCGYGCGGKSFSDGATATSERGAVARGASLSEGVECVREEDVVENKSHEVALASDDVRILANYVTRYNYVRVLEVSRTADSVLAGARVLLLDKPGNVHSIYQQYKVLTEAYYDILASLPAVIPEGPIGILGLGAGTAARLIHHFWPEIDLHGWELDPGVVEAARNFFDLEELEWQESGGVNEPSRAVECRRRNSSGSYGLWVDESDDIKVGLFQGLSGSENSNPGGRLRVHIGDALNDLTVGVGGGFAGLIVDLFAEGAVIPELQEAETWRRLRAKLRPQGRIMVNCGGSCVEAAERKGVERKDGGITMQETIAAIVAAFPGELSVTYLRDHGDNSIALTGPPPNLEVWRDTLPECLRHGIEDWRPI